MINRLRKIAEFIEIQKMFFVLPFAISGAFFSKKSPLSFYQFLLITLAVFGAWTLGHSFKRIIDLNTDSQNPRKKSTLFIPEDITMPWAWAITASGLVLLLLSATCLKSVCLKASFIAVLFMGIYPFIKRFHFTEHFALGAIYGFACLGGWLAISGDLHWQCLFLFFTIVFWIASLSIIANLEDLDFYKTHHLFSIGSHFGRKTAFKIARICQWAALSNLILFGLFYRMSLMYWAGLLILAMLFLIIHRLYLEDDKAFPSEIFFKAADWIAVLFLFFAFMETFR